MSKVCVCKWLSVCVEVVDVKMRLDYFTGCLLNYRPMDNACTCVAHDEKPEQ